MTEIPLPYRTFSMRLVPMIATRRIRVEFWEEDGSGRGVADAKTYRVDEWTASDLIRLVEADVQGMFEAAADWLIWMDADRP